MSEIRVAAQSNDLASNKGYGTKKHIEAIKKYGITKYHRLSFKPVSDYKDKVLD